jgi:hypothetical protein
MGDVNASAELERRPRAGCSDRCCLQNGSQRCSVLVILHFTRQPDLHGPVALVSGRDGRPAGREDGIKRLTHRVADQRDLLRGDGQWR